MSVGAITPVGSGSVAVYAVDPVTPVPATPPAPAPTPVASPLSAPAVDTTPPYLNPAIPLIAAAASAWPIGFAIYGLPVQPAVPPVAPVSAYPRVGRLESGV